MATVTAGADRRRIAGRAQPAGASRATQPTEGAITTREAAVRLDRVVRDLERRGYGEDSKGTDTAVAGNAAAATAPAGAATARAGSAAGRDDGAAGHAAVTGFWLAHARGEVHATGRPVESVLARPAIGAIRAVESTEPFARHDVIAGNDHEAIDDQDAVGARPEPG